jgi:hypothetical protein
MRQFASSKGSGCSVVAAIIIVVGIAWLANNPSQGGSLDTSLHGGNVLVIDLKKSDGFIERVEVSDEREALHTFLPAPYPDAYSITTIPANLWVSLEELRHVWCIKPPTFKTPMAQTPVYEVAIQCERLMNPVLRIPQDQMPQSLLTLIASLPPPPQRHNGYVLNRPLRI